MPCSDITELLTLQIGTDDRLLSYRLEKVTCGGAVGMPSLIKSWAVGKPIRTILEFSVDQFLSEVPTRTLTGELVHIKHLLALQKGLSALSGTAESGPHDACAIESIAYNPDGISLSALIRIDIVNEEIKACTGCGVH